MKILIVTPFFPYRNVHHAGGKFVYDMITNLSDKHEIHLFSRVEPDEMEFTGEMETFCKSVRVCKFRTPDNSNPLKALLIALSYFNLSLKASRIVRKEVFDIVQVEHMETGLLFRKSGIPAIIDAHDVLTKPAERRYRAAAHPARKFFGWLYWQIIKKMEMYIIEKFDCIFTRSEIDRDILLKFNPELDIEVIPHPVEVHRNISDNRRDENIILFAGAMHRDVNIQAVLFLYEKVFPLILPETRGLKLYVVGNNPPAEIRALAAKSEHVVVTGFVEDMDPYFNMAAVCVTPIFIGGGIIAKNLQAMSYGIPLITTHIGNEGIRGVHGRDLLIADNENEFAQAILDLLKDPGKREKIGRDGKKFVDTYFNKETVMEQMERTYERLYTENIDNNS